MTGAASHVTMSHMAETTENRDWILAKRPDTEIVENRDQEDCRVPNDLAEATYRYSLGAQRLMHHISAHIPQMVEYERGEDGEVAILKERILRVPISVVKDLCGVNRDLTIGTGRWAREVSENERVDAIADELYQRPIKTYVTVGGKRARYRGGFLAYTLIYENEQYIEFYMNPPLLSLYLSMSRYVKMGLALVAEVRSQYTMRVYVLLKQYEGNAAKSKTGKWERRIEIGWLREHLAIEPMEYKNGADFRVKVIEQSVKEINNLADIQVSAEYVRGARNAIVAVVFTCRHKARITAPTAKESRPAAERWTADDKLRYQALTGELYKEYRANQAHAKLADSAIMDSAELEAREIIEADTGRKM